ncbi:MAG: tRNA1(Val) (adenine(37)-N6)-methyltransferase [Saprospiraceae bacterium]
MKKSRPFRFKQFDIYHDECAMKVGTDGVLVGAWADVNAAKTVLDIGTGSGLIAIMAAQKNQSAHITGIDIDEAAYQQALKNVQLSPWSERISIQKIAIQNFAHLSSKYSFDSIISNPPYFNNGTKSTIQKRQIARHTQDLSYEALLQSVDVLLNKEGVFSVILPYKEGLFFQKTASQYNLQLSHVVEVRSKKNKPIERLLMAFKKKPSILKRDQLIIQFEERNNWTPEYVALTKEFYFKM